MVELCSFCETSLLNEPHGRRNIIVSGTSYHTGSRIGAVNTAGCLKHGAFNAEVDNYLIEITCADVSRAQIKIIKRQVYARFAVNCQRFTWNRLHEILQWRKCGI